MTYFWSRSTRLQPCVLKIHSTTHRECPQTFFPNNLKHRIINFSFLKHIDNSWLWCRSVRRVCIYCDRYWRFWYVRCCCDVWLDMRWITHSTSIVVASDSPSCWILWSWLCEIPSSSALLEIVQTGWGCLVSRQGGRALWRDVSYLNGSYAAVLYELSALSAQCWWAEFSWLMYRWYDELTSICRNEGSTRQWLRKNEDVFKEGYLCTRHLPTLDKGSAFILYVNHPYHRLKQIKGNQWEPPTRGFILCLTRMGQPKTSIHAPAPIRINITTNFSMETRQSNPPAQKRYQNTVHKAPSTSHHLRKSKQS